MRETQESEKVSARPPEVHSCRPQCTIQRVPTAARLLAGAVTDAIRPYCRCVMQPLRALLFLAAEEGDPQLVLDVLATLYAVTQLGVPAPRPQPTWSSLQETLDGIFDTLIDRRVVEHGFDTGTQLHAQVKRAAALGARIGTHDVARWN
jgi:hypothetical protein